MTDDDRITGEPRDGPRPPPASALTHDSPAHLRGLRAASTGMRATALVVDAVVVALISAMCLMPTVIAARLASSVTIGVAAVFALLGAGAVVWFEVVDLWMRGQTLGMRVVGISWLRWSLPGRPGLNALAKLVVLSVISGLTLGVGAVIIYLISEDRSGRSWFDRVSDIIVVTAKDTGSGEEPAGTEASGPAAARGGEAVGPQWLALRPFSPPAQSRRTERRPRLAAPMPPWRPPGSKASSLRSRGDPGKRRRRRRSRTRTRWTTPP